MSPGRCLTSTAAAAWFRVVTRVRAALSRDERRVLLEESRRVEFLAARVEAALGHGRPAEERLLLHRLHQATASARERLTAAQNIA